VSGGRNCLARGGEGEVLGEGVALWGAGKGNLSERAERTTREDVIIPKLQGNERGGSFYLGWGKTVN